MSDTKPLDDRDFKRWRQSSPICRVTFANREIERQYCGRHFPDLAYFALRESCIW